MQNTIQKLSSRTPLFWLNPEYGKTENLPCGMADILDAEARLMRFAPLLAELFDEAAEGYGVIESQLLDIPRLSEKLLPGAGILLKADHDLPVAGSVKARGGIYNVLCFAEDICLKEGVLSYSDNYRKIAEKDTSGSKIVTETSLSSEAATGVNPFFVISEMIYSFKRSKLYLSDFRM